MAVELEYEILRALDDTPEQTTNELVRTLEGAGLKVSRSEVNDWLNLHERDLVLWESMGNVYWRLTPTGHDRLTELAPQPAQRPGRIADSWRSPADS